MTTRVRSSYFSRALAVKPDFEFAHRDLIAVLFNSGRLHETRDALQKAISVYPESGEFQFYLGNVFRQEGDYDNAIACYEQVLRLDPENPVKHLIAALSGQDSERAPSDFVETLFDDYADKFDSHLVKVLSYSTGKTRRIFCGHTPIPPLRNGPFSTWVAARDYRVWCWHLMRGNSSASICPPRCSRKHGRGTCTIVSNNSTC